MSHHHRRPGTKHNYNIEVYWKPGLWDKEWNGWYYHVGNFSSGPYQSLVKALNDAADLIASIDSLPEWLQ